MATQVDVTAGPTVDTSPTAAQARAPRYYLRFDRIDRVMHATLMLAFIGCALSGMPLLLSDQAWSAWLAAAMGGFRGAGLVHRVSAAIMIVVLLAHVLRLVATGVRTKGFAKMLWGPTSMVPQPRDIRELVQHVKWFLGKGPRPLFDRYTYWEKFDYWAVFWGMFIIGGSGLLLWFPTFWTIFFPGWILNIAHVVHGEEALLAVGFIFTIHFFNGHVRPEKFPMDPVIFTGRISERELKEERTTEYQRLVREGRLAEVETTPPSAAALMFGYVVGGTAVIVGTLVAVLIVYALAS